MTQQEELELALRGCKLETIQDSTFLEPIQSEQETIFHDSIRCLLDNLGNANTNRCTITFRGVTQVHLAAKLSKKPKDIDENKLLSLVFYFGDKAKHYYRVDDNAAKELRWLARIEDISKESNQAIFDKIQKVLNEDRENIRQFAKENGDFYSFFQDNANRERFSNALPAIGMQARDYFLYLLHTAGKIGITDESFLVSS